MDSAGSATKSVFLQLTSPEILAQVIVIVVVAVTGFMLAHAARRWQQGRKPVADAEDWQVHALDGAVAVAPMILVVALLLLARGAFSMLSMRTRAIDTVVQLATALVLVRIAVYLLGVLVGPQSWFRRWENRITWGLAVTIGFELVGWFTPTQRLLDSIELTLREIQITDGQERPCVIGLHSGALADFQRFVESFAGVRKVRLFEKNKTDGAQREGDIFLVADFLRRFQHVLVDIPRRAIISGGV